VPLDDTTLRYVGGYVSSEAVGVTGSANGSIPGNLRWIDPSAFAGFDSTISTLAMLEFRTTDIEAVLNGFTALEPIYRNEQGRRTVMIEYDGVAIRIEEALPTVPVFAESYRYHSFWIPRSVAHDKDVRLDEAKMYVNNQPNPFGVGWVRYDADAPYDPIIRSLPHIALSVDDVERAVAGREILIPPKQTQPGLRIAFVQCGGLPVEFVEVDPTILPDGI